MYAVYMVQCNDGTFYTGIARDVTLRIVEHNESPKGAKYTKARRPVRLVYQEEVENRSAAQRREYEVKQLTREQKEVLVRNYVRKYVGN